MFFAVLSLICARRDHTSAASLSLSLSTSAQAEDMLASVARLKEERGGEEKMFMLRQALGQVSDVAERATDDFHSANKVCSALCSRVLSFLFFSCACCCVAFLVLEVHSCRGW